MEEAAYIRLIEENHARLVRLCRFYERVPADQEDLYQEILYQVWRSRQRFRGESQASTWIYRIAVNTALTHVRTHTNRSKHISRQGYAEEPAFSVEYGQQLDQQTQQKALQQAISGLSAVDRTLILLYLEERTYQEMAQIMGLSESNVGVRLNRIKKKLAIRLKGLAS